MKATAIEFRLRMMIQIVIVIVGVWAPWLRPWDLKLRIATLEWLALTIGRTGLMTFAAAVPVVIAFGILLAAVGAWLRVWGGAYLGYSIVHNGQMQAGGIMTAGPYRYMRNPLYLGGWFVAAAVSLFLTPSGALFILVLVGVFFLRLILGEEAYLAAKLGEPYQEYIRTVPRIIPRLRTSAAAAVAKPNWITALVAEAMPVGVLVTMAAVPWSYDNIAALRWILISLLVSLIVRGMMKALTPTIAFLVVAGASWGLAHLSVERAVLIGFGAALVLWALMPQRRASAEPDLKQP